MLGEGGHGSLYKAPTMEEQKMRKAKKRGTSDKAYSFGIGKMASLQDSGREEEGKTFHNSFVLGKSDDLWDRVRGLGSLIWKGCK